MTTNFRLALEHTMKLAKENNTAISFQCGAFIRNCKDCYFHSTYVACANNGSATKRTYGEWVKWIEEEKP